MWPHLCSAITPAIINCYRHPARLFVGGECLLSREGTTQGNPLAMPMYALGVLPLVRSVATPGAHQCWYADDASAGDKLASVHKWWDRLVTDGPVYDYFTNPSKSVLLVKLDRQEAAQAMFSGTGVTITTDGCRHLGSALGSQQFVREFMASKVTTWSQELCNLSEIARSRPQAAYSALVHGLQHKWSFLCRVTSEHLAPLEDLIHHQVIPAITGRVAPSEVERLLLTFRAGMEGWASPTPHRLAPSMYHRGA